MQQAQKCRFVQKTTFCDIFLNTEHTEKAVYLHGARKLKDTLKLLFLAV